MSGRRVHSRFSQMFVDGQLRISKDVTVQTDAAAGEIAVLCPVPGVVGDEMTLALVDGAGETELRVRVVESRLEIVNGVMRHRVRLAVRSTSVGPIDAAPQQS